jgi:hypothetical protein
MNFSYSAGKVKGEGKKDPVLGLLETARVGSAECSISVQLVGGTGLSNQLRPTTMRWGGRYGSAT